MQIMSIHSNVYFSSCNRSLEEEKQVPSTYPFRVELSFYSWYDLGGFDHHIKHVQQYHLKVLKRGLKLDLGVIED